MKEEKEIKINNDFFINPKIKKLRKVKNGDRILIIYLKLHLLSLDNEGALFFQGIENSLEEELSLITDESLNDINDTLEYLISQKIAYKPQKNLYIINKII